MDRIPRTGKFPVNDETPPEAICEYDMIPNDLVYVRCHGPVPDIAWRDHLLEIRIRGSLHKLLTMDQLIGMPSVTFPMTMVCDGNRRKEINQIRRSNGFDWGHTALSTFLIKGVLLRCVLLASFVDERFLRTYSHVCFESTEKNHNGTYGTSISMTHALDETADVLLAYGMNGARLPPEHGFPLRTVLPGCVGGRTVKWLKSIDVTRQESPNYYHLHDNSVFPPDVVSTAHVSNLLNTQHGRNPYILYELNLNSAILQPFHGETLAIDDPTKVVKVIGYAYDGGGRRVVRVEVTLDDGDSWLQCEIWYPPQDVPRHGTKYWTMCRWKVDIPMWKLAAAKEMAVRAHNASMNTQPEHVTWNLLGMMNNAWYRVRVVREEAFKIKILHPVSDTVEQPKGWYEKSPIKYEEFHVPAITYSAKEVARHNVKSDCWIIVDDKIYDVTAFLDQHPGGSAPILAHAGTDVTELFYTIHSYDTFVLKATYVIGSLEKTERYHGHRHPRRTPEGKEIALNPSRWTMVTLKKKENVSHDTRRFVFALPSPDMRMWLPWGKHIDLAVELPDRMVTRPYTPVKPILSEEDDGTFECIIKIYFPTDGRPGGEMTQILEKLHIGDSIKTKGPEGQLWYVGNNVFNMHGNFFHSRAVNLVVGGTGITPALAVLRALILAEKRKDTDMRLVFSNKSPRDVLCDDIIRDLVSKAEGKLEVTHAISDGDIEKLVEQNVDANVHYEAGHVNVDMLRRRLLSSDTSVCFLCGPPAFIANAVVPALEDLGFDDEQIFEF